MKREVVAVEKPACLLVLGMHRSGTSALTRVLNIAGAALPATLMGANESSNPTGHWEPDALVQYHDRLLAELESSWHDWRPLDLSQLSLRRRDEIKQEIREIIDADYANASLFVLKDPRICRFAPFFMELLQQKGIEVCPVLTFRNPLEVCESLEKRDGMVRADAALLWLRHVLDAEKATRNQKRAIISYNHLLADWKAGFTSLTKCSGLKDLYAIDEIKPQVEEFLSSDCRHHVRKTEEVLLDPVLRDWVGAAYQALLILARNPGSTKAMDRLDTISGEFNNASPVLKKFYDIVRTEREGEIGGLKDALAGAEGKTAELAQALGEREQETAGIKVALAEAEGKTLKLTQALGEREQETAGLKEGLSNAKSQKLELETRLSQAQGEAGQLEATLAQRGEEIAELKQLVDERERGIRGMALEKETLSNQLQEKDIILGEEQNKALKNAASLQASQTRINELQQQLVRTHDHARNLKAEFRNSTSWKLTRPLRAIAEPFKGIKKKPAQIVDTARTIKRGIEFGGGIIGTTSKVANIIEQEGVEGISLRVRNIEQVKNRSVTLKTHTTKKKISSDIHINNKFSITRQKLKGKRNILVVGHTAGIKIFGSEFSLIGIVSSIDKSIYSVHAVFPQKNEDYFEKLKPYVESITTFPYSWRSATGPVPEEVRRFEELIIKKNIDIVHSNTIALQSPLIAAKNIGVPSIVHCREIISIDPDLCISFDMGPDKIIQQVSEEADYCIANSEITQRTLRFSKKCFRIYNEVDTEALNIENNVDPERIYVGLISSNIPKKGIAEFIALARLAEKRLSNLVFRLIGPENQHVKKLINAMPPLPGNLEIVGYQENPLAAISKANIVMSLSTFAESFGRTIAEAMAARRPVIAYSWGAVPELFTHGKEGLLIPYLDYKQALPHLEVLAKNPKLIHSMGESGRKRAASAFSRETFAKQLDATYDNILK